MPAFFQMQSHFDWQVIVTIIAGVATLFIQSYFKDKADARRNSAIAENVKETAELAAHTNVQLTQRIEENTQISKEAVHEAAEAKAAIVEVSNGGDALAKLSKELQELKDLVKGKQKDV